MFQKKKTKKTNAMISIKSNQSIIQTSEFRPRRFSPIYRSVVSNNIATSFLPTASFLHPIVNVKSAPDSRETIKQVYAVYKVLTKDVKIYFQSTYPTMISENLPNQLNISLLCSDITIDPENTRAVVELEESVSASFVPFGLLHVERVKIITVLDLVKDKRDGKYYISRQYGKPLFTIPTRMSFNSSLWGIQIR